MLRKVGLVALVVLCGAAVVGFQSTRHQAGLGNPRVFVPAPTVYEKLGGSFTVPVADAYWLYTIQYYGEHVNADHRLDSLPALLNLVTGLSPHFTQAYFFGAFALLDAGRADLGYHLLLRGYAANPRDWHFPFYLGFFVYTFGKGAQKDQIAAEYYAQAAKLPGHLPSVPRLAADLYQKGHDREKAIMMWAQVYGQGDKYSREKAVAALDQLLPRDKTARMKAVAALRDLMTPAEFNDFIADIFKGYY
jgi:hypothetical protein